VSAQVPALQTWPAAQTFPPEVPLQSPEAPQKARSVVGSTQWPVQLTSPAWQLTAQAAALQTSPEGQAVPAEVAVQLPEAPQ